MNYKGHFSETPKQRSPITKLGAHAASSMQGIMNEADETELYRLCELLEQIGQTAKLTAEQQEALKKAALSLSATFVCGFREQIEGEYAQLVKPKRGKAKSK